MIFLTAANEEEAQSMLRQLAAAQGYFDLIGGGIATLKNYITLQEAFSAANTASAASSASASATSAGLGTAATNLVRALGPAVAVVASFGASIYYGIKEGYDDAQKAVDAKRKASDDFFEYMRSAQQKAREVGQMQLDIARGQSSAREQAFRGDPLGGASQLMRDLAAQQRLIEQTRNQATSTGLVRDDDRQRLQNAQTELQYFSAVEQVQRDQLSVLQQVSGELERQQSLAQSLLQSAKQKVETEKRALESRESAFGRLTPGEQSRAVSIADSLNKGGKLNEADARFLESANLGGKQTEAFFRERGQQAGAGAVAKAFGFTEPLEQAEKDLRDANAQFGSALQGLEEELTQVRESEKKGIERLVQLIGDRFRQQSAVNELVKRVEQLERNANNRAASAVP